MLSIHIIVQAYACNHRASFQNMKSVFHFVLDRMIAVARGKRIDAWRKQLRSASAEELEMFYTHLSNGLMKVVVEGYDKYSKEAVVSFVDRMVKVSLSLFA